MATKAEQFRATTMRARPGRRKRELPIKPPGLVIDTSRPGLNATSRKKGGTSTAARNRAAHAARKASFALEDSLASGAPTRKSTRKSANRSKPDNNFERKQKRRIHSPKMRAVRAAARA
jgi:hypothetical protein